MQQENTEIQQGSAVACELIHKAVAELQLHSGVEISCEQLSHTSPPTPESGTGPAPYGRKAYAAPGLHSKNSPTNALLPYKHAPPPCKHEGLHCHSHCRLNMAADQHTHCMAMPGFHQHCNDNTFQRPCDAAITQDIV